MPLGPLGPFDPFRPPKKVVTVELHAHVASEVTTGLWCPVCVLPAAIEADIDVCTGRSVVRRERMRFCPDCRERLPLDDE